MIARALSSALLGRLTAGHIELLDYGERRRFGPTDADLSARLRVNDSSFWRALPRGSLRLAEAYAAGGWDSEDLVTLVRIGARELPRLDRLRAPFTPLRDVLTRLPRNTRTGARRNVAAHYDLGNDMFRLFLDDSMTYSCAVFERPDMELSEAQEAKLERACRKLELRPQDHLLEIGTGWGALALHAAREYGCRVTTTTISREQREVALERVREAGLEDRVEVVMRDYRELRGRYSKLISIEMIEAVGWQYFDEYFRRCSELLEPDGLMLLQAITIDHRAYEVEKASRSFAKSLIFPGGCLPSLEVIRGCTARVTDMRVADVDDITVHYPPTLRTWRENWLRAADAAEALGYDRPFRRLWELYLAWSEGGFRERRIQDHQLLLAKLRHRARAPAVPPAAKARAEPAS